MEKKNQNAFDVFIRLFELLRSPQALLKKISKRNFFLILIAALIGSLVGLVSVALKESIEYCLQFLYHGEGEVIIFALADLPMYMVIFLPAFGGLCVGIYNFFVATQPKAGVEQVMEALAVKQGYLSMTGVLSRFITSIITLGSGGSAGKEGPVVHIGGGIGSGVARLLRLPEEYVKALVGAGAAAGIAAAFNAPIAGTFFTLEILLADISLNVFSMIMAAAIAATAVSRYFLGEHPAFAPAEYSISGLNEFLLLGILAIAAGYICILFIRSLIYIRNIFVKLPLPNIIKPAIGGLLIGLLALFVPNILGVGMGTIGDLLRFENHPHSFDLIPRLWTSGSDQTDWFVALGLAAILFGKILATSITLGSGGSGGTILPSLFLGAVLGALVGHLGNLIFPSLGISVGGYALIGMSSIIAGTTQAPIMAILLFFEITRGYNIILPVAIVSIMASQISKFHLKGSMYTLELKEWGIDLYEGMEKTIMSTFRVDEIMRSNILVVPYNMPLKRIMELFLHTHFSSAIVLDKMGGAIGRLHLDDLKRYVESRYLYNVLIASEVMDEKIPYLLRGDSLSKSFEIMNKDQIDIVPVMESANELKPIGYISRQDVLDVYHKQIMQKNMSGMRIKSPIAALSNQHLDKDISLNPGYEVKKIPVPNGFIGQTLSGLQMRSKYGLTVLTILNDKSRDHIIPEPGYCFQVGDIMVVGGSLESIAKLDKNRN